MPRGIESMFHRGVYRNGEIKQDFTLVIPVFILSQLSVLIPVFQHICSYSSIPILFVIP